MGGCFHTMAAVCVCGQLFAFVGSHSHSWAALVSVGGWFHCSLSLAWGAVWWLSSVASLCGGYGG